MDDNAVRRVWEIAEPLVAEEGMEIVDIECRYEGRARGKVLRVYLDKPGSPDLDELSRVSRQLSDLLDVHDPIDGPYTLEVSSPGINRPLKRPEHFARYVGKRIRVRTREPLSGRRSFLGRLTAVEGGGLEMEVDRATVKIPFALVEKANYEHDWEPEGRRR
jgi:ribosome maturation factor RimP